MSGRNCHITTALHPPWEDPDSILGQGIDGSRDKSPARDTIEESCQVGTAWAEDFSLTSRHTAAISPACPGTETNRADFHSDEHRGKEKQRDIL